MHYLFYLNHKSFDFILLLGGLSYQRQTVPALLYEKSIDAMMHKGSAFVQKSPKLRAPRRHREAGRQTRYSDIVPY